MQSVEEVEEQSEHVRAGATGSSTRRSSRRPLLGGRSGSCHIRSRRVVRVGHRQQPVSESFDDIYPRQSRVLDGVARVEQTLVVVPWLRLFVVAWTGRHSLLLW